jgi:cysteine desulfurase/selenocysteine lyase
MSTFDSSSLANTGRLPAEASLVHPGSAAQSSSSPVVAATPPLASPGVGLAATRVPTAPTLPDDPASLLLAVSRMANDLFARPELSSAPTDVEHIDDAPVSAPAAPAATPPPFAPAPTPPASAPAPSSSSVPHPFLSELNVAALFAPSTDLVDFHVPLLDAPPSTPAAAPAPTPAPPAPVFAVPHELDTRAPEVRPSSSGTGFNALAIKSEFPILRERVNGKQLVWLDNAATTQKPQVVIDRLKTFYERENSNIHRAAHALAARATDAYESARESVRRFLNASSVKDVVFVRGTTEGINLVAQSWGRANIGAGDEIVLTNLEHHANIVPWQLLAQEKGAIIRVAPVDDRGQIILEAYERLLTDKTKLVSMTQVSNALGTVTPAQQMIEAAQRRGIKVMLDGAQSVSHQRVDLQALHPDFFVFSGHKIFGPTGIGAVVAKAALLDEMPPWQGGGNMIQDVTFEHTVFQPAPARFEAGTGNIADAVGLGAALDWVARVGIDNIGHHEHELLVYGTEKLLTVPGLRIIGTAAQKAGVLSFVVAGHDTQQMAQALDKEGIAVRGGHHCAQPILRRMGLESTVRASLAPYNTTDDLDALHDALCRIVGSR